MKTKTFLTAIGLITSQSLFYSCSEDTLNTQQEMSSTPDTSMNVLKTITSYNYFENAEPFNGAVNFIKSYIAAQGPSYTLTQSDLNLFYTKAQIPVTERLSLDQVNQALAQTIDAIQSQLPFSEIVQQSNFSDAAKTLIITIDTGSMSNLEADLTFKSLPEFEKNFVRNFNNFQYNLEQGYYQIGNNVMSKEMGWEKGAKIGMMFGTFIGFAAGGLLGAAGGAAGGALVGAAIGSLWDDK